MNPPLAVNLPGLVSNLHCNIIHDSDPDPHISGAWIGILKPTLAVSSEICSSPTRRLRRDTLPLLWVSHVDDRRRLSSLSTRCGIPLRTATALIGGKNLDRYVSVRRHE